MTTNTLFCLKGLYPSLTINERRLADYFFDHAAALPQTPMLVIARACQTSKPAVVRLCKKLGFSGYKSFLTTLSAEIAVSLRDNRPDFTTISTQSSAREICAAVAYWKISSLEDTVLHVNGDHIETAVQLLMDAAHVDLCGLGSGVVAAHAAAMGLRRPGMHPYISVDPEEQCSRIASLNAKDVLMVLSDAGPHEGLLQGAREAREKGAHVVAIVRRRTPAADHASDVIIQYAASDAPEEFCTIATRTAMLCAVDMLVALAITRASQRVAASPDQLRVKRGTPAIQTMA